MMSQERLVAGLVVMFVVTCLCLPAQTVTFSDQVFNDSDWTAEIILNEVGNSANFLATQEPGRGNPGPFRKITHEAGAESDGGEIQVAHLHREAVYDPQEGGPIGRIDYSYDLKNLETQTRRRSSYYLVKGVSTCLDQPQDVEFRDG